MNMNTIFSKNASNYLYLAFILELLLVFYFRNELGFIVSPLLMLLVGLYIAYAPLFFMKSDDEGLIAGGPKVYPFELKEKFAWIFTIVLLIIYCVWSAILFQAKPLDINQSDILPFIKEVYLDRLFKGEPVYSSFSGFNYGTFTPSYLPAHWAPFIIPYWLNIDLRWACVGVFGAGTLVYTSYIIKLENNKTGIIKLLLPWLLVFSVYIKHSKDAAHTIEVMILGYYLILGVFLFSRSSFKRAIGIILPLFSRYAFMFWLPVYALIQWLDNRKIFTSILVWGVVLVAIILLPFVIQTPEMYKDFNGNYLNGIINEWQGQSWQNPGDRPFQLFQGMGFASWFYFWFDGTLPQKINAIKNALVLVSILFMVFQLVIVWRLKIKLKSELLAICTLKAALTIFYVFVMVPYVYLNWVPLIISVVILSRVKNINA